MADKWIEWYVGLRNSMVTKYGQVGISKTGNPMPRITWQQGLVMCLNICVELANAIDIQNERQKSSALGGTMFTGVTTGDEPVTMRTRLLTTREYLAGVPYEPQWQELVKQFILEYYRGDKTIGELEMKWRARFTAQQIYDMDPTKRICMTNAGEIVLASLGDAHYAATHQWFFGAITHFTHLSALPSLNLMSTNNLPGVGYLKLDAVEAIFSETYKAVLDMETANVIPTISWGDVATKGKELAEEALDTAAKTGGAVVGWTAQQVGKGIGTAADAALDATGMWGIALLAAGVYIVVA